MRIMDLTPLSSLEQIYAIREICERLSRRLPEWFEVWSWDLAELWIKQNDE